MNSNNGFLAPIVLRPERSLVLCMSLYAVHGATLLIIPWLGLPPLAKTVLLLLVIVGAVKAWHRFDRLGGDGIVEAMLYANGDWFVRTSRRDVCPAMTGSTSFVQPWLTVIQFRLTDKRRRVLILVPDNIAADVFRRLRVRLRCGLSVRVPD